MLGAVPPPAARPLGRVARVPQPVCPGCGRCGCGDPAPAPQRAPLRASVARCGGGGRASPGGVPFTVVRGVWSQALPLPRLPAHSAGCWGPPTICCGRGCAGVGAQHCPLGAHAVWGLRAAGVVGGRPRGGGACHRCEGRLGSGAPPPSCPPSGRAVGVRHPRAVGAGVRAWGPCSGPVARVPCGGLRATGVTGGVWVQAPPLPCCPPPGRAPGARWPRALGAGVGVCGVCGVCAVRVVVRGAAFRLSLSCPPLWCFGAVLCPPCAVCLPCPNPCARPLLSC